MKSFFKPLVTLFAFTLILLASVSSFAQSTIDGDCWPATVWPDDCQCAGTAANPDCWLC